MVSRRGFLTAGGVVALEAGLSSCCPTCPSGPGIKAKEMQERCEAQVETDPEWGAGLRSQFRVLECLSGSLVAVPAFERQLAKEVQRRFLALNKDLSDYTYSRTIAEAWRLFYELTSRLHVYRNARSAEAKIPVYAHNAHQHAARMWIDESRQRELGPMVHFDTHDDMRGLNAPDKILESVARVNRGGVFRTQGLRELQSQIHDHATPVSGGVLGIDFKDVVWCFPYWAYASEFGQRPMAYADVPDSRCSYGTFRLLHDRKEDGDRLLPTYSTIPWLEVSTVEGGKLKKMTHRRPFLLTLVKTYPTKDLFDSGERWEGLLKAVPKGRFLLDIDADYFMSIDSASGFRRGGEETGRGGARKRQRTVGEYEKRLVKAVKLIDKRLEAFRTLLAKLRDAGRLPSMVTLADSTYMPFASTYAGRGYWEYTPYEFAAYIHWKLRLLLADVYGAHGIDAGV